MLKEKEYIYRQYNAALDWVITAGALGTAHFLRNYVLAPYIVPDIFRFRSQFSDYWWLLLFLPTLTVALLAYSGHYRSLRVRTWGTITAAHIVATVGASLTAIVVSFIFTPRGGNGGGWGAIFSEEFVSRGVLLLYMPVATGMLGAKELIVRYMLQNLRHRGLNVQNLLLVGPPDAANTFLQFLKDHPYWGFHVVGLIKPDASDDQQQPASVPVVGTYSSLMGYLDSNVVDDVVFLASDDGLTTLEPMLRGCEEMGIRTRIPLAIRGHRIAHAALETFDDLPVITFNPVREYGAALFIKYTLDRVLAALLLILLSPLMLVILILIKMRSTSWGDPAFYGQTRCGLNGHHFTLWKFRSMIVGADRKRVDLEPLNEMSGPVFKMKNDPRVTGIGGWLRRTSLDELPQLWNVLRGEMSLVGPRPPLPDEVRRYDRWQRRRLSMKPGVTCIWQVNGRNRLSFEEWMAMDLQYIDTWSLALDCKILVRTVYVVITGYGAM